MELIQPFRRHDLIWFTSTGWEEVCAQLNLEQQAALQTWRAGDFPAIVRRRDADAADNDICIGFALPPQNGQRLRIAARVRSTHVTEHQSPLALNAVIPQAAIRWRDELRALQNEATLHGLRFRVYGSLALQFLTGQSYLQEGSDIDLLLAPHSQEQLSAAMKLLRHYQQRLPLDGEIVFPGDWSVAWKEWLIAEQMPAPASAQRVLVKDLRSVRLMNRDELLRSLPPC